MIRHILGITREGLINRYPLSLIPAGILINRFTWRIGLYPRVVALPGGLKIFVNNPATINTNIPDQFVRREYSLHGDFIPRRGFIVLDIGAYVGIYSLWASRLVGNEGFVIAFEPNPLAYQWLVRNIKLNEARNIHAIPYALGESLKAAELLIARDNMGASSFIKSHITNIAGEFRVPVVTLDWFVRNSVGLVGRVVDHVDIAKVDVEGYELMVLRGATNTLGRGLIDRLVIEVHTDQVSTRDVINYLGQFGYVAIGLRRFGHVKDILYVRLKR